LKPLTYLAVVAADLVCNIFGGFAGLEVLGVGIRLPHNLAAEDGHHIDMLVGSASLMRLIDSHNPDMT